VFQDPQVVARGMKIAMDHPKAGRPIPLIASPIRMSKTPVDYRHAPPTLGQHTDAVLREVLDMSDAEIRHLRDAGVV
jgi:crotonobetainyl-CoA:carnitine CoA-transferase CaiB-like acyl-CoA transferase